jgi:hypothetical protein
MAGVDPEQIHEDVRQYVNDKARPVSDREIGDAIHKAVSDFESPSAERPWKPSARNSAPKSIHLQKVEEDIQRGAFQHLIKSHRWVSEEAIRDASPIRVPDDPKEHAPQVVEALWEPHALLFMGRNDEPGILGKTVVSAELWSRYLQGFPDDVPPQIIPNPLSGELRPTKAGGKVTLRGDGCVAAFKYAMAEFDDVPREEQLAFWGAANLPISALIDSGGKSIHAWIRLDGINSHAEWDKVVRQALYDRVLVPLGVDPACKNPSRLSRMPGHFREEKGRWQRLLYLAPQGRRVLP